MIFLVLIDLFLRACFGVTTKVWMRCCPQVQAEKRLGEDTHGVGLGFRGVVDLGEVLPELPAGVRGFILLLTMISGTGGVDGLYRSG